MFSRLHGWSDHKIVFAQRGHKLRTKAFVDAITHESEGFAQDFGLPKPKATEVICSVPKDHAGLQAADYYLWALQRFYERGEARYLILYGRKRLKSWTWICRRATRASHPTGTAASSIKNTR